MLRPVFHPIPRREIRQSGPKSVSQVEILAFLNRNGEAAGVDEIAEATGLSRYSVYHGLQNLYRFYCVTRDTRTQPYRYRAIANPEERGIWR